MSLYNVKHYYPSFNSTMFRDYPELAKWINSVGIKYRHDFTLGDAWTYDQRDNSVFEYSEDERNEDDTWAFPTLTSSVKADEIELLLKEMNYEGV